MAPLKPLNQKHFLTVANAVNKDTIILANKLNLIEKGAEQGDLTSRQILQLVGIALKSEREGGKRYKKILAAFTAILELLGKRGSIVVVKKEINGHEYVEMGDGLKWATCNVGASKPEEKGDLFLWGETEKCGEFETGYENYKWHLNSSYADKYGPNDKKNVLEMCDDAASVNWGGSWRMPTKAEWEKLTDTNNFIWKWDETRLGYTVTSRIEGYAGNQIFLPIKSTEYKVADKLRTVGLYWSATLYEQNFFEAYQVLFYDGHHEVSTNQRCYHRLIRPVSY